MTNDRAARIEEHTKRFVLELAELANGFKVGQSRARYWHRRRPGSRRRRALEAVRQLTTERGAFWLCAQAFAESRVDIEDLILATTIETTSMEELERWAGLTVQP